jgi:dsRNA-specific ribonuclease
MRHQEELAFFDDSLLRMVIDKILMEEFPYYEVGYLSKTVIS